MITIPVLAMMFFGDLLLFTGIPLLIKWLKKTTRNLERGYKKIRRGMKKKRVITLLGHPFEITPLPGGRTEMSFCGKARKGNKKKDAGLTIVKVWVDRLGKVVLKEKA